MNDCEKTSQPLSMSFGVPGTNYFYYHNLIAKLEHFALILDYQIMQNLLISELWGQNHHPNSKTIEKL